MIKIGRTRNGLAIGVAAVAAFAAATLAAPKNYLPDVTFTGSALTGWQPMGQAAWKATNGEIAGTAQAAGGGWLLMDKGFQDVQMSASFRCVGECSAGLLLRAEKTASGMKGVFVSLSPSDLASYRVTLDQSGKETSRERLSPAAGQGRYASIRAENTSAGSRGQGPAAAGAAVPGRGAGDAPPAARGGGAGRAGGGAAGDAAPATRGGGAGRGGAAGDAAAAGRGGGRGGRGGPPTLRPDWNEIGVIMDADRLALTLNEGGGVPGGDTADFGQGYGPIALYVGSGEVRFKDVAYKDLRNKSWGPEQLSSQFRLQVVSPFSYTYSSDVADINRDGTLDIVSGPYYYLGPDFGKQREIYPGSTLDPGNVAPVASRIQVASDFTGDGWPDVLRIFANGVVLYVNPQNESRRWQRFDVGAASTEMVLFQDIDGDGKPELLLGGGGNYGYAAPDPANPTGTWPVRQISQGNVNMHGMGIGDINKDGRLDFVAPSGWWEQPAKGTPGPWPFHEARFGGGGAEMCVYDINGDGRTDVVTSLAAHGWGLAWFEQKPDGSFQEHPIMGDFSTKNAGNVTFSELHGGGCADINGDKIIDIVTGKRYWSHLENYTGPDPYGAPVVYVYKTTRNPKAPGGAEFVPEMISNRTGVGSNMVIRDINKDGLTDIVNATNLGTFVFWGQRRAAAR